jgi:hypothetical protein
MVRGTTKTRLKSLSKSLPTQQPTGKTGNLFREGSDGPSRPIRVQREARGKAIVFFTRPTYVLLLQCLVGVD